MSNLLFYDSADHNTLTGNETRKWTQAFGGGGAIVPARTNNGYNMAGSGDSLRKTFSAEYGTLTIGHAFFTNGNSGRVVLVGNSLPNNESLELTQTGDGRLSVIGFGLPNIPLSPGIILANNTWYYIESKFTIVRPGPPGAFTVSYEIHVNGSNVGTGTRTSSDSGLNLWSYFEIGTGSGGQNVLYDDIYCTDGEFLGDLAIYCLFTNAAGDLSQWTPNPAVANYLNVTEHSPDDFTTTVASTTAGQSDLYNMDNIAGNFVIPGAQFLWCTIKSDAGPCSMKGSIKSGGVTVQTPEFFPSQASWQYLLAPYRKSPFTGNDWTVAEINAIQQGQQRIT